MLDYIHVGNQEGNETLLKNVNKVFKIFYTYYVFEFEFVFVF